MNKFIKKVFMSSIFLLSIVVLIFSFQSTTIVKAQGADSQVAPPRLDYSGFVQCDGVTKDGEPYRNRTCDFAWLIKTIISAINWMFVISIPVATVLFAYAGLLYIHGTPGSRTSANKIFTSVGVGFIIMITAWIGVRTVVGWFVKDSSGATIFLDSK